jgi:hypothetical protein
MIDRYGYEKARRIGVVAMIGGKDKTKIRNATPIAFRDILIDNFGMVSFGRIIFLSFQSSFVRTQSRSIKLSPTITRNTFGLLLPSTLLALGRTMDTPNRNITSCSSSGNIETGFLNSKDAHELDQKLFNSGYTLEQLMELAGLSVSQAVFDCVPLHVDSPRDVSSFSTQGIRTRNILVRHDQCL